ncbi:hypothetical protein Bbelb_280930, partial [Branchiostoma belcheri]
ALIALPRTNEKLGTRRADNFPFLVPTDARWEEEGKRGPPPDTHRQITVVEAEVTYKFRLLGGSVRHAAPYKTLPHKLDRNRDPSHRQVTQPLRQPEKPAAVDGRG